MVNNDVEASTRVSLSADWDCASALQQVVSLGGNIEGISLDIGVAGIASPDAGCNLETSVWRNTQRTTGNDNSGDFHIDSVVVTSLPVVVTDWAAGMGRLALALVNSAGTGGLAQVGNDGLPVRIKSLELSSDLGESTVESDGDLFALSDPLQGGVDGVGSSSVDVVGDGTGYGSGGESTECDDCGGELHLGS